MRINMTMTNRFTYLKQVLKGRKIYNLVLKEIQFFLGHSRLLYFPNKLTVDIGNICNLKCPLCPTGQGAPGASRGFMSLEAFMKVIDELGGYLTKLELHNWGEPLLNKDVISMIQYAKDRRIPVCISTNLTRLDEKMALQLVRTRIDKVFISCDGASPETYSTYRVGGDFDKVIANIHLLAEAKERLNNHYTRLILLFHVFRHNEHEIEKIKALAEGLGVELRIHRMRTDMGKELFEKTEDSMERDKDWIPRSKEYCLADIDNKGKKTKPKCKHLWNTTVINWDGAVLPCCAVYGEKYRFGNALKESFASIWNNEKYRLARREVLDKIKNSHTICHTCKENGFLHF